MAAYGKVITFFLYNIININFYINITTFSSTACIRDSNNLSMGNLCNCYKNLEKKCNILFFELPEGQFVQIHGAAA